MARRSRLGAVCCDKFRFGSVSQGTAVLAGEVAAKSVMVWQGGRGAV